MKTSQRAPNILRALAPMGSLRASLTGFRGLVFSVQGSGFRVWGLGYFGFRVWGLGFRAHENSDA